MKSGKKENRIYLDHASTTPVDDAVLAAMKPFFSKKFHNPSALYKEGIEAAELLGKFRSSVASSLHALSDEIIFTGSGTESVNLAILGVLKAARKKIKRPNIIVTSIEHPSVLELADEIESLGGSLTILPVDNTGLVDPKVVRKHIKPNTVLISVMYANNEIGTVEPIKEIAKAIRHYKKHHNTKNSKLKTNNYVHYPYFHTDASQAANYLDLNVLRLGVDLLSLDGSKIYGPKGVGVLFSKRGTQISPVIYGGGQEFGLRSGTENLAGISGFAKALEITEKIKEKESKRLSDLRDRTIKAILKKFPKAKLNGQATLRLPNNLNICFPGIDGEFAVILADNVGIECSTASSCRSLSENAPSYVLEAIGDEKCAGQSLRFTMGRSTKESDMKKLISLLPKIVSRAVTS